MGTSEFKIPAVALLICVWAFANRKAGKAFPNNATAKMGIIIFLLIKNTFLKHNGINVSHAIAILSKAISYSLNTNSDFLIRINELPQINDKEISRERYRYFDLSNYF